MASIVLMVTAWETPPHTTTRHWSALSPDAPRSDRAREGDQGEGTVLGISGFRGSHRGQARDALGAGLPPWCC